MLRLFDTMAKDKVEFNPEGIVSIYTCGPTVYLDLHIGNWRTFIFYDTLVRVLKENDYDTNHVLNITDVGHLVSDGDTGEDKLAKTAKAQRKTAWEVAEQYTNDFLEGISNLNMLKPSKLPKATDHIQQQIAMVQAIEGAGYAYKISDGIYFDTGKLDDYGKLAGGAQADEDFARINQNDEKRSAEDFALWKFSPDGEQRDMEWDSPWGVGFPGWHIECSAMAKAYLGDTIDIHAGGIDHIPVHHTNEIAQSETANNAPFASTWLHTEFMKVDGAKMSKSKDNFYTLADISDKGFTPMDFRMLVLQGHYRTETNFTWDTLQAASNLLRNIRQSYERVFSAHDERPDETERIQSLHREFIDALNDDINTPQALSILSSVTSIANNGLSNSSRQAFIEFFQLVDRTLGLNIVASAEDISVEQKELIKSRDEAKQNKDYATADEIRDTLDKAGIVLLDTPGQTSWMRKH